MVRLSNGNRKLRLCWTFQRNIIWPSAPTRSLLRRNKTKQRKHRQPVQLLLKNTLVRKRRSTKIIALAPPQLALTLNIKTTKKTANHRLKENHRNLLLTKHHRHRWIAFRGSASHIAILTRPQATHHLHRRENLRLCCHCLQLRKTKRMQRRRVYHHRPHIRK